MTSESTYDMRFLEYSAYGWSRPLYLAGAWDLDAKNDMPIGQMCGREARLGEIIRDITDAHGTRDGFFLRAGISERRYGDWFARVTGALPSEIDNG